MRTASPHANWNPRCQIWRKRSVTWPGRNPYAGHGLEADREREEVQLSSNQRGCLQAIRSHLNKSKPSRKGDVASKNPKIFVWKYLVHIFSKSSFIAFFKCLCQVKNPTRSLSVKNNTFGLPKHGNLTGFYYLSLLLCL